MQMNMLKKLYKHILCSLAIIGLCGCIENDIPYARIQANFTAISADGESKAALIDTITRTVTFYLPEQVDIENVRIASYTLSENATVVGDTINQPFNLTKAETVTLRTYQDWQWTFAAVQNIERYFTVNAQVGSSTIDIPARRVVAYVSGNVSLDAVKVESVKLGPEGSVMTPDLNGQVVDFTKPVEVEVAAYGKTQTWTIYVDQTDVAVTTERVDAWTRVAWVYGQAEAGESMGVQYRLKDNSEWIDVPADWITVNGGSFHARIIHLTPGTAYEARATSGENYGETLDFTTGTEVSIPDGSFDNWWLDGKIWCPWAQDGTPWWGTGNKGATTLGPSNTQPTSDTPDGKGYAAKLETKFVGIGLLGKLAAGNIFAGTYVRTDGTNGVLSFGREFTQRPTKLRAKLKYKTAPISSVTAGFENIKNQPDTCILWVSLIDSANPFEIRTNPNNRQLFNPDGAEVIAYGKYEAGYDIDSYIPVEITIDYKATNRVPRYVLITASASKYGDYFTGGNGAVLYLDDLEFDYDY